MFSYVIGIYTLHTIFKQVDQGSLGLPNRKYLLKGLNDSTVVAYYETMVDMALALGAQNKSRVRQEMMEVIHFETKLANVRLPAFSFKETRVNNSLVVNRFHFPWKTEETSVGFTIK